MKQYTTPEQTVKLIEMEVSDTEMYPTKEELLNYL